MNKITQKQLVLDHFRRFKAINILDSIELYGITRLSAQIYTLKHKDKYIFDEEWVNVQTRYGNTTKVKNYILVGKEE